MKNIDRLFITLSQIFLALKECPSDCPDDEIVKGLAGIKGYAKLTLNRVVELLSFDEDGSHGY